MTDNLNPQNELDSALRHFRHFRLFRQFQHFRHLRFGRIARAAPNSSLALTICPNSPNNPDFRQFHALRSSPLPTARGISGAPLIAILLILITLVSCLHTKSRVGWDSFGLKGSEVGKFS